MTSRKDVTQLLHDLRKGKKDAGEALLSAVYNELRALAKNQMRFERQDHTLQATALVHEAYLRLGGEKEIPWKNRAHYMCVAARAMRRVLIDHARRKLSEKRGKDRSRKALDGISISPDESPAEFLALDLALEKLSDVDPFAVRLVELRFHIGLTVEETARIMEISSRTVKRKWRVIKVWIKNEITRENDE